MRFGFAAVALLATTITHAATPIDGWYASAFGGYAYIPNNIKANVDNLWHSNASYKAGYDAGGNIGFKSTPMRYEGEITYLHANLKNFSVYDISQTGVSGFNQDVLAMANVYYDFPNFHNSLQPYLGIGIGYAWINTEFNSTGPSATTLFNQSNNVFSYQGAAGIIYNFSENYALNAGYRYVATTHISTLGTLFQAQLANLGVIYRFNGNNYK